MGGKRKTMAKKIKVELTEKAIFYSYNDPWQSHRRYHG